MKKEVHCAICGAEFESKADLDEHDRRRHTQQGVSGLSPSNEYPVEPGDATNRKDREFDRSNLE